MSDRKTDKQVYREKIGSIVRTARESRGISVRSLAQQVNMNHSTLSRAERGQTDIDQPTLARIANLLNIATENLSTEPIVSSDEDISRRLLVDNSNIQIKYIFDDKNGLQDADELDTTTLAREWLIEDSDTYAVIMNSDVINKSAPMGYIVAIAPNLLPQDGEIILFQIDEVYHIRRYYTTPRTTILEPDSNDTTYETFVLTDNESHKFEINGVLIGAISNQNNHL
ncbi:helix-turn-helix domain-containing protein [Enterococcus sp. DIV0187]|uniref:helix-turn-helix domain-containing protein n=1 Tax=Enterococcus sp. DIV0187 TaxID=2774644 RepID=UPI003F2922FB